MNATTSVTTVVDPVCGMTIDPANAVGSTTHEGSKYHFCSRSCETKFDAEPQRFTSPEASEPVSASCCSTGHSCC
jgi:P-type Cu+ transporter